MSLAAAMKPKGLGGGWLSMAPQMDDEPVACTSSTTNSDPACTEYSGYQQPRPRIASTAPRRLLPRTTARFMVGDSSALATPASPAPESPYSGGSLLDSPPPFDVRSSFAPMPLWGAPEAKSVKGDRGASSNGDIPHSDIVEDVDLEEEIGTGSNTPDDDKGILHAGIQWRGKTAHAVEQEMEALGDRTVMSYAPDAVYLASRLEGLKRNLEVGGQRLRRWAWEDEEEDDTPQMGDEVIEEVEQRKRAASPVGSRPEAQKEETPMPVLEQDAGYSVSSSLNVSEGITPSDEVFDDPMHASTATIADTTNERGMPSIPELPTISVDTSAGKAAALDARVEIRTLRRPDLEQVRELHCYHGDSDKIIKSATPTIMMDVETYNTSAGFLLRLLVDEHHVCLVAVAKPLPEPPSLPSRFSPAAPPPSLDMPPSKSPFLIAGQSRHASSSLSLRKQLLHPHSTLAPLAHSRMAIPEATAPRSFGVGANSSSSVEDEEDSGMQDSLFEAAKKSSEERTRATSSSERIEEDDEEGQAEIQEEDSPAHSTRSSSPDSEVYDVLAGPTHDVAPPRAIRVMGAPPLNGMPRESETILGVASARIKVVQKSQTDDAFGKSEALDSSWPGLDSQGDKSMVTREAHIITLAILPGERSQGLGARLLDRLLDECKRRTAGPRLYSASSGSGNPTQEEQDLAPRMHENAPLRTFMEVHPTNTAAINLYKSRKFSQVEGPKGIVKHYFRGDNRIPNHIRVQVGGSDAIRLERLDFK